MRIAPQVFIVCLGQLLTVSTFGQLVSAQLVPQDQIVATNSDHASLRGLAIVDDERIICVGDCGLVLISSSSGRNWQGVQSHTTANLYGVDFSSEGDGLAVGGWIGNYTRQSHAVILRSNDAGQNWTVVPCGDLPRLKGVRIVGNHVYAWGDYSTRWKTSIFESLDGGVTWRGIPSGLGHAQALGVTAAGQLGAVDRLGRSHFTGIAADQLNENVISKLDSPLTCLHHTGERWLACGHAGQLIASDDGRQWVNLELPLSSAGRQSCVWQTITQFEDDVWVAGFPGSLLLHSTDRGRSWQLLTTNQTLPVTAVRFFDSNRGWAVGPMGLILATRDRGRTWYPQRLRTQRLGMLAISANQQKVPWSPLIATLWDDRLSAAAIVVQADEPIEQADFLASSSMTNAYLASQLGLADLSTWCNPNFDITWGTNQLAVTLACWKPDILLVSETSAAAGPELVGLALAMCQLPGQSQAGILAELGLRGWRPSKLVTIAEDGRGQFNEQDNRILNGPGLAIWDLKLLLGLLGGDSRSGQTVMRTDWSATQAKVATSSLMGGVAPSDEIKRQVKIEKVGNYQLVMGRVHRQKSIDRLVTPLGEQLTLERWNADFDFVLQSLPAREVAAMLHQLAERMSTPEYTSQRQLVLNRMSLLGNEDAADWARIELLNASGSDERGAWRNVYLKNQEAQGSAVNRRSHVAPEDLENEIVAASAWKATPFGDGSPSNEGSSSPAVVLASATTSLPKLKPNLEVSIADWFELLGRTHRAAPMIHSRPDLQVLTYRKRQQLDANQRLSVDNQAFLREVSEARQLIGWPQVVQQEMQLATNQLDVLRWKVAASYARSKPRLDGVLEESFWHQAPPMVLTDWQSDQLLQPPLIRWGYDASYLYFGIEVPRVEGSAAQKLVERREYDSELSLVDHIHIWLDTDRDYSTAIELAVSEDGRTYDRCCGDKSYNPKWHVSVRPESNRWTAEVAIELPQLTQETMLAGSAWAVSASRKHPNGQAQSWSQLRTHTHQPYGSGLLLFIPEDTSELSP